MLWSIMLVVTMVTDHLTDLAGSKVRVNPPVPRPVRQIIMFRVLMIWGHEMS